jgi:hypothetical protein
MYGKERPSLCSINRKLLSGEMSVITAEFTTMSAKSAARHHTESASSIRPLNQVQGFPSNATLFQQLFTILFSHVNFRCIYFHLKMVVRPKHVADNFSKIVSNYWNSVALNGNPWTWSNTRKRMQTTKFRPLKPGIHLNNMTEVLGRTHRQLKLKSKLLYDSRSVSMCSCRAPLWGSWPNFTLFFLLPENCFALCLGAPSLTRERVCNLWCNLSVVRVAQDSSQSLDH